MGMGWGDKDAGLYQNWYGTASFESFILISDIHNKR